MRIKEPTMKEGLEQREKWREMAAEEEGTL